MTEAPKVRLAADRAYTLEFCKCGKHPRLMSVAALLYAYSQRKVPA